MSPFLPTWSQIELLLNWPSRFPRWSGTTRRTTLVPICRWKARSKGTSDSSISKQIRTSGVRQSYLVCLGDIVRGLIEKYQVTLPYAAGSDLLADRRIGCAF